MKKTFRAWKHYVSTSEYIMLAEINGKVYNVDKAIVGHIWGDRTLQSGKKAFAKGNPIVNLFGDLYELTSESIKPLKLKKGFYSKKINFLKSRTAWVVFEHDDLYFDVKTRNNDELI